MLVPKPWQYTGRHPSSNQFCYWSSQTILNASTSAGYRASGCLYTCNSAGGIQWAVSLSSLQIANAVSPVASCVFCCFCSYLVTNLMGADLNNIVKFQRLSDEHVQFLIYQLLRGLKVNPLKIIWPMEKFICILKITVCIMCFAISFILSLPLNEVKLDFWLNLTFVLTFYILKNSLLPCFTPTCSLINLN